MQRKGAATITDLIKSRHYVIEVTCDRCERRGKYHVKRVLEDHGDEHLTDTLQRLTANCPGHRWPSVYGRCLSRVVGL